ncbi:MAG: CpsB/CapC family capsule biosynthesis tyrosine phosphatase [Clostridia bacterium]
MLKIDFHTHILPRMDDGSKSIEQSKEMLKILAADGVDVVVLTPHFYINLENCEKFLQRRKASFEALSQIAPSIPNCPKLLLGAEVYYYSLLSNIDLQPLCIENTNYLLVELPFLRFNDTFYTQFSNFVSAGKYKIILAHIDRYFGLNSDAAIENIISSGNAFVQINASSLIDDGYFKRKKILRMIADEKVHIIGTDTHNLDDRKPEYKKAENIITTKLGKSAFDSLCFNGEKILSNADKESAFIMV